MRFWMTGFVLMMLLAALPSAAGGKSGIGIKDGKFAPATVTIAVGDSVVWTNNDNVDHRVIADDGSFDSGKLKPGESYSKTFSKAGTISFSCSLHPREKGSVVVK
jgi:plastocyanin